MSFEIRKGVPKPSMNTGGMGRNLKYPFGDMEVGDSFLISQTSESKSKRLAAGAINNAHRRFPERKFSQRVDDSGGIGIWRDADLEQPRVK